MALDRDDMLFLDGSGSDPWESLPPPPRPVAPGLRRGLFLRHPLLLLASAIMAIWGFIGPMVALSADPEADAGFPGGMRTAAGVFENSRMISRGKNAPPAWQYRFTFQTPDGRQIRAVCYGDREIGPEVEEEDVVVEYDARRPSIARIVGTRTGGWDSQRIALACLIGLVGPSLLASAWIDAAGRARLLERGEATLATIREFRVAEGENSFVYRPFSEYRLPPVLAAPVSVGGCLLTGLSTALLVAVVTVCGVLLRRNLQGEAPLRLAGLPLGRGGGAGLLAVLGLAAVVLCIALIVLGGSWLARPMADRPHRRYRHDLFCRFAFRTADGREVVAERQVTFRTEGPLSAVQRVLYDPERPRRALLVDGLDPPAVLTAAGAWEPADEARAPVDRILFLVVGWLLVPLLGLTLAVLQLLGWL